MGPSKKWTIYSKGTLFPGSQIRGLPKSSSITNKIKQQVSTEQPTICLFGHIAIFWNPRDRYVVISVDPAGGGALSDEVFVVFLIADDQCGLLTARVVPGQNEKIGFSMIPLVFIISLLKTIVQVKECLQRAHSKVKWGSVPPIFKMPPVLVLIEPARFHGTCFLCSKPGWTPKTTLPMEQQPMCKWCGSFSPNSVRIQSNWHPGDYSENREHSTSADIDIIFATPVYGLNNDITRRYIELAKVVSMNWLAGKNEYHTKHPTTN